MPENEWSDSVRNRQICGRALQASPAVVASYRDGDYVYLVSEIPRLVDGVVRYGYYAEKWLNTGTREWRSDLLFTTSDTGFIDTDRSKATAITSDGSHCWVAIAENDATGGLSTMFRLDALDGDVLFEGEAGASDELTIYSLAPTGDNKCYIGHNFQVNEPWVSTWDDDTLTDRFGVFTSNSEHYVSSIVPDGDDIYLGHTLITTDRFGDCQAEACGMCFVGGAVSRWNAARELVWLSYGGEQAKIAKSGSTVFVGVLETGIFDTGDNHYGALDDEWGDPLWFRRLDIDAEDTTCGMSVTDISADTNFVWISACRHIVQTDHLGIAQSFVPHVHEDDIPAWNKFPYAGNNQVLTVAAIQDDTAVGGGRASLCDPETPLAPEDRTTSEVECDPDEPLCDGGSESDYRWCNFNDCGRISTNGRRSIAGYCDQAVWPPCEGPFYLKYTDCDDVLTEETFNLVSEVECTAEDPGLNGPRYYGTSPNGATISIRIPCDGSFGPHEVSLTIPDCTVTVDTAEIVCDGPMGYAAIYITFSGTCGECAINGCGAFGAETCEIPSPCGGCDAPPTTAFATVTSSCGAVNGATGSGDRVGDQYEAALSACGLTATLICQESGFNISVSPAECFLTPLTAATGSCDPFSWSASFLYINGGSCTCCATGSITVTFTA